MSETMEAGAWAWAYSKRRLPEANLVAELYHEIKIRNVTCLMEMKTPVGRLDLAVLSPDLALVLCIVEAKSNYRMNVDMSTNQIFRYQTIGVQIYPLARLGDCVGLADLILQHHYQPPFVGVPLTEVMSLPRQRRS